MSLSVTCPARRAGRSGPMAQQSTPSSRLGTRRRAAASARSKESWAYSPDSGYPMAMSQSSAVRKRYSPSRKAVPCDMACMNGAECSGTRACSRTEARSGMASSRFCGNGPLPDTRFPADLSRAGRRFGVWDAGRSAGRGGPRWSPGRGMERGAPIPFRNAAVRVGRS